MAATKSETWKKLAAHQKDLAARGVTMKDMFAADKDRFEHMSATFKGKDGQDVLLDYSKNIVDEETLGLLEKLVMEDAKMPEMREKMFTGEKINCTEQRAVLHTALRNRRDRPVYFEGKDVMPKVYEVLEQMRRFTESVRSGEWRGATGERIHDIVNIGIGGSDLGPCMVCAALKHYASPDLRVHFVSNVDGTHMAETLKEVDPKSTLFVVVSKTFTTLETIANATTAKKWFLETTGLGVEAVAKHFVRCRRRPRRLRRSALTPRTCLSSGTGLAAATRCGRRWVCRSHSTSAWTTSWSCWRVRARWTITSAPPRSARTCRACLRRSASGTTTSGVRRARPFSRTTSI